MAEVSARRSGGTTKDANFSTEIKNAIAAHGNWKAELQGAISSGKSGKSVADAKRDDACAFGKWLRGVSPDQRTPQHKAVADLHARFHQAAGHVLELATGGKTEDAKKAMAAGSAYADASAALTKAMMDWLKH